MRNRRKTSLALATALGMATLASACGSSGSTSTGGAGADVSGDTVKVGILHSSSGTMAISEQAVIDAEVLAIEEINKAGGVLGKKIDYIKEDGASDWPTFADKAGKLLATDKVAVVFGGWTSASRKAMKPVFEGQKGLLFYPVQYEGMEVSPNIFYTGATTNQQIVPGLEYLKEQGLTDVYLVGSDYVFPRTANKEIKAWAAANQMNIIDEKYLPLGDTSVAPIVSDVLAKKPKAIFNTLNGDSNVAFFKELKAKGNTPDQIQTISVSIAEEEVKPVGVDNLAGHLVAWTYYETTENAKNKEFVKNFKARYGADRRTADPIEAGYNGVYIWKAAVEKAGSFDVEKVKEAAKGIELDTPEGPLTVSDWNQHVYKTARIGKIDDKGVITEVWASKGPIEPDPCLDSADWAKGLAEGDARKECDAAKKAAGK
jgi:urea transport system substrate-binding protein